MTTIITKNSSTAGAAPTAGDLVQGELAVNVTDKALYTENASGTVVKLNAPSIVDNGNATAITIDSSENVGIGASSPSYRLDVTDNSTGVQARLSSSSSGGCSQLFTSTSTNGRSYRIGSNFSSGTGEFAIYDATAGTERLRFDSSGNLLVGTTSSSLAGVTMRSVFTGNEGIGVDLTGAGSADQAMRFGWQGTAVGAIALTSSTTSYVTSSDYRLKNTVEPLTGALTKVAALKPCTYKWNADGSDGEGFIAHELAEVCPAAVTGEKDAVDADGNPQYQGIDTSFLVATLTAAIQELKTIVDAQAARINALEQA